MQHSIPEFNLVNIIVINQLDMSRQEKFSLNNLNHKIMH